MATITGLTADRMLAIEAASVVDGDVIGGNLILTKHDGSQINAGPVTGPVGPQGPVGSVLSVLNAVPVLDVGLVGQIRAGRQLTAADFTAMGLSVPIGLWNLSDLSDASGNGRALLNKGAVPFDVGINGGAATAAKFVGSASQAFYISDTGAADPFRVKTGSWGCWFRTAKRGLSQQLFTKASAAAGQYGWFMSINASNQFAMQISPDGTAVNSTSGGPDVADDRWHFGVGTSDGSMIREYVDGVFEGLIPVNGPMFGSNAPLNIGGFAADGSAGVLSPHFGRIDEAFVTSDVLSEDQIRNLYCAKIPHTFAAIPSRVSINVRRRRKGAAFAVTDFPTQPLRLHNFSGGSLGDEGSGNVALTNNNASASVAGADGSSGNAFSFNGTTQNLSATDTGLPSGVNPRSYGCWIKTFDTSVPTKGIMAWGAPSTKLLYTTNGSLSDACGTAPDFIAGGYIADGQWHFVVMVEDNASLDGVKRKMYLDGKLIAESTAMPTFPLAGAGRFRVGSNSDGTNPFPGQVDSAFICDYALKPEQIAALYGKGSQTLISSPKSAGDHTEGMSSTNLFATFDAIEVQHTIDLMVS